eukprot:2563412-Prymnesium_polylepis.1
MSLVPRSLRSLCSSCGPSCMVVSSLVMNLRRRRRRGSRVRACGGACVWGWRVGGYHMMAVAGSNCACENLRSTDSEIADLFSRKIVLHNWQGLARLGCTAAP